MWSYVLSPSPAFVPANYAKLLVIWFVNLKNIHSLKVELCFIWWEILELLAQEAASQITLRELFKGVEES